MIGTKQKPDWRVVCRQPEKGKIVATLVYGGSRRAHGTAHDSHELETLRRQAKFLNERRQHPQPLAALTVEDQGGITFHQASESCFPVTHTHQTDQIKRAP